MTKARAMGSARGARRHAALMLLAITLGAGLGARGLMAALGLGSLGGWIGCQCGPGSGPGRWGLANAITALRAALAAALLLLPLERLVPWGGVLVLAILVLDGVD
ncbi:MAG: hypothetical protein KDK70_26435, partial [Myxococcales bacterium]|nr:hypothetical protein [Myxococcales bacterium]